MKKLIKNTIANLADIVSFKTSLDPENARYILQKYSSRPSGICKTNNQIDLCYDLQVIIPAYNAEKFIHQCVCSVASQITHYQTLITIVNDGSTDGTARILDGLSKKIGGGGTEVEVITQENKGFSGARNIAMKVLKGNYIFFLDSDDVLAEDSIEKMLDMSYSADVDILKGSWYTFCNERQEKCIVSREGLLTDNYGVFSGFPWGKLYKHTVLEHFKFPEGYWFEDTPISFILAAIPYRCAAIKDIVYGYRLNPEGITAKAVYSRKSVDSYWITEECLNEFSEFGLQYDQRAYEYLLRQSVMNWRRTHKQVKKVREAIFVLTVDLMNRYFNAFQTEVQDMKKIEYAIRNREFRKYEFLMFGR